MAIFPKSPHPPRDYFLTDCGDKKQKQQNTPCHCIPLFKVLAGLMQFAGKWRVKDPEMVWKGACLWVHFREEVQKRTSASEYQELDVGVRRGVYTQQLNDHVKAENPNFTVDAFRFLHSLSSFVPVIPVQRQTESAMDVDALANNEDPLKVQGEVAFEMGMLTKIGNLLLKEQKLWTPSSSRQMTSITGSASTPAGGRRC